MDYWKCAEERITNKESRKQTDVGEQICTATRNRRALKCNYGTCKERQRYVWYRVQVMLSVLMHFCLTCSHVREIIKNLIQTVTLSTYRACQSLPQCSSMSHLLLAYQECGISETSDKYQHPPFICQGLQLDRNPPSLNVTIPIGSSPHSRMRYVT